jgi:hypothetical protein
MRICLVVSLSILLGIGMLQAQKNLSTEYLSIDELYKVCHVPGVCGKKMDCEGQIARVKGYIDYDNVFDKKSYPQLPYEKFKIHDTKGESLEVWALSDNNKEIFEKIYHNKVSPEKMTFVKGSLTGFDMPIIGTCRRGLAINITKASDIFFQ